MSESLDLSVEVHGRDILVAMPGTEFAVTYRKQDGLPLLVAIDAFTRADSNPPKIKFLVGAWRAAHSKAKNIGWLNS
jgi:hypothetical protein